MIQSAFRVTPQVFQSSHYQQLIKTRFIYHFIHRILNIKNCIMKILSGRDHINTVNSAEEIQVYGAKTPFFKIHLCYNFSYLRSYSLVSGFI